MALDDELVHAKYRALQSAGHWLDSQLQKPKGLSAERLEATVLKIETGIGMAVLVDVDVTGEDLPFMQKYADKFVLDFLGYLRTPILQATDKVNFLMARKGDTRVRHILSHQYDVERVGPGHFQAKRENLVFPIIHKYAEPPKGGTDFVHALSDRGHVPPQPQEIFHREGY